MQLKRLELIGFKSFAQKTTFDFEAGITGLVGPNGCGKSNVVDAIKWILGEQSVKSLRGKQMADVIYNGGVGSKALASAEASLTFDNSDRVLSPEGDEVSVTRRIYQTGQSEYFINKKSCRLKDIKTMFLDTGIGVECYSVIEQGRIDRILQASAQERREVFEEAAGVSKYKVRRKEAQAKLERTQANLLRVQDIVEEVAKQLRSVKYQAAKARRYRTYSDELQKLRVSYSLNDYHNLKGQLGDWQGRHEEVSRERLSTETAMRQLDATRSDVENGLTSLEDEIEEMQRRFGELQARVSAGQDAVRFQTARAGEQGELRVRFEEQRAAIILRLEEVSRDLLARAEQMERAKVVCSEKSDALAGRDEELADILRQEERLVETVDGHKGELIGVIQEAADVSNQLSALASDLRNTNAQLDRLDGRLQGARGESISNNEQAQTLAEEIVALDAVLASLDAQRSERMDGRRAVEEVLTGLNGELETVREQVGSTRSRIEVLADLEARQEGVEKGVRAVLEGARSGVAELSGVLGMLGETIQVQDGYAQAVEAALGHRVQMLICRRQDDSRQGLQRVHEAGGRASFVALSDLVRNGHDQQPSLEGRSGVVGKLRTFVSASGYSGDVLDCLLDGVYLVENLDEALRLRGQGTNGHGLVTLAGEVIEPTGVVTGGRGDVGGGLLTRIEELKRLAGHLDDLKAQAAVLQGDIDARRDDLLQVNTELERLDQLREQTATSRQSKRHAFDRIEQDQDRLEEEMRVISSEQRELVAERDRLGAGQTELRNRLEAAETRKAELTSRVEHLNNERERFADRRATLQNERTELKVELARAQQMLEGLQSALEDLCQEQTRQQNESERLSAEVEQTHLKENEANRTAQERRAQVDEMRNRERELGVALEERNAQRQERRDHVVQIDESARGIKERLADLDKRAGEAQLGLQECRLKMENCVARVREEYELDIETLYGDYQPEDVNWEETAGRIEELRSKLHNMGPVNLEAIHDEESLQERLDFLTKQKDDLEAAMRKLEEIIRKINRICRDRFQQTFAEVRSHFQEMFRKLFGGGKADLFLEDASDILESGVEIIARPPGKEPRALSLLSGGEKVLTAVALLFAIFKTKPSPFCILDEVDAALDEANVGRFCSVVQEFLDRSQFIIITHSKRTMSIAGVLYGITMPTSGVSRKVMIKFEDYEQQVA